MSQDWESLILLSVKSLLTEHQSCYGYYREISTVLNGLTDDSHSRRYAVQSETESCFCERDQQISTVEFVGATESPLGSTLDSHVVCRVRRKNRAHYVRSTTAGEIERRLSGFELK